MSQSLQSQTNSESQWKGAYVLGGIATVLCLVAAVADVVIGSSMGGNLAELPQTAVERFVQFQQNPWLGLYNLDLLNTAIQLISVTAYFALYGALRRVNKPFALLALIIFLLGTAIFVANNAALPMLELSQKYSLAAEAQKPLLAAAGEALLARGAHGSLGAFFSFFLPILAGLIFSLVMFLCKIFSKATALVGILGNLFMLAYMALVTFAPSVKTMAMAFAMPGGLLLITWMILFALRLFQLGSAKDSWIR